MAPSSHRGRKAMASAVAVMALAGGCTAASAPRSQPSATSPSAGGPHQVDADLGQVVDTFFANDVTKAYRNRRALIVSVDGRPVIRRFYKITPDTTTNIQSAGKTIVGTLIGIALGDGQLRGLDQTVAQLLPSYRASMRPQVAAITLRQLLTMTAGLPPDDVFYPRVFNTNKDWVRTILADGPDQPPGQGFEYSSAGSHLLSVILSEATGHSVLDYARKKLFDPLGIDTTPAAEPAALSASLAAYSRAGFAWPTDPQGHHIGGGGLKLTPGDLAKLGQLWLNNGRWGDRQLVPAAWMRQSHRAQVPIAPYLGPTEAYGYQTWVTGRGAHDAFAAVGYGGQLVEVVPDLGLVVVVLSDSPADPSDPTEPGTADAVAYMGLVESLIAPAIH